MSFNSERLLSTFIYAAMFSSLISVTAASSAFAGAGKPGHGHGDGHKPGHHMMPDGTMMKGDKHMEGHHGDGHHGNRPDIGMPGKAEDVKRTITITMQDNYFEPEEIAIKAGETVRFKIVNKGTFLHEFGLGTAESHAAHQKMMAMMMDHGMIEADRINHDRMKMDHGPGQGHMNHMHGPESGSVLVEPGKTAEMVWKFSSPLKLEFACNIPGHYESGMVGPLSVQ